jgi:hypothetical protein
LELRGVPDAKTVSHRQRPEAQRRGPHSARRVDHGRRPVDRFDGRARQPRGGFCYADGRLCRHYKAIGLADSCTREPDRCLRQPCNTICLADNCTCEPDRCLRQPCNTICQANNCTCEPDRCLRQPCNTICQANNCTCEPDRCLRQRDRGCRRSRAHANGATRPSGPRDRTTEDGNRPARDLFFRNRASSGTLIG